MIGMEVIAPDIEGGQIDLDENGKPLGIFRERARACILDAIPEKEVEEIKELGHPLHRRKRSPAE